MLRILDIYGYVKFIGGDTLVKGSSGRIDVNSDAHLILENVTIDGQNTSTIYPAISLFSSSLTINEGTKIINVNNTTQEGSAIYSNYGNIVMNGGLIQNNGVIRYGNIYLDGDSASHPHLQ